MGRRRSLPGKRIWSKCGGIARVNSRFGRMVFPHSSFLIPNSFLLRLLRLSYSLLSFFPLTMCQVRGYRTGEMPIKAYGIPFPLSAFLIPFFPDSAFPTPSFPRLTMCLFVAVSCCIAVPCSGAKVWVEDAVSPTSAFRASAEVSKGRNVA